MDAIKIIGKAPEPGGLPALYYKYFDNNLILSLQTVMDSVLPKGIVPESWKAANTALIHKEVQNPTFSKNLPSNINIKQWL